MKSCDIKTSETLNFLHLKNNSVTLGFFYYISYLLSYNQIILTLSFSLLDHRLLNFHKHHKLIFE